MKLPALHVHTWAALVVAVSAATCAHQGVGHVGPRTELVPQPPNTVVRPRGFRKLTQFEPSGLLWVEELDRYLVVSDDTGLPRESEDVAWVFTMDREGRLDPEPLPLEGLETVIDLESVARGPRGFYVLSSNSATSRGVRPEERELLVRLRLGPGRRLAVEASQPLLAAIARAADGEGGESWLSSLGLGARIHEMKRPGPAGSDLLLDIEGLAWWDGGLLLGLKEPRLEDGRACIWRLADPDAFLDSGRVERKSLTRWSALPLTVRTEVGPVRLGISGLMPLDAGRGGLAVTSTVPGAERFHLGALWLLSGEPSAPRLRLVRAFPGLKPEGVTVGPEGGLTLVFDAGGGFPLWLGLEP